VSVLPLVVWVTVTTVGASEVVGVVCVVVWTAVDSGMIVELGIEVVD